jgi:hypothetical protein
LDLFDGQVLAEPPKAVPCSIHGKRIDLVVLDNALLLGVRKLRRGPFTGFIDLKIKLDPVRRWPAPK